MGSRKFEEAVIAFRGTENRPGQMFHDWRSNIAVFFGFEPAQYAIARTHMVRLIDELAAVLVGSWPASMVTNSPHPASLHARDLASPCPAPLQRAAFVQLILTAIAATM